MNSEEPQPFLAAQRLSILLDRTNASQHLSLPQRLSTDHELPTDRAIPRRTWFPVRREDLVNRVFEAPIQAFHRSNENVADSDGSSQHGESGSYDLSRILLIGDEGTGKSTNLKHLELLLNSERGSQEGLHDRNLGVLVNLTSITDRVDDFVANIFASRLKQLTPLPHSSAAVSIGISEILRARMMTMPNDADLNQWFERRRKRGAINLIVDGLDSVPENSHGLRWLTSILNDPKWDSCQIIVAATPETVQRLWGKRQPLESRVPLKIVALEDYSEKDKQTLLGTEKWETSDPETRALLGNPRFLSLFDQMLSSPSRNSETTFAAVFRRCLQRRLKDPTLSNRTVDWTADGVIDFLTKLAGACDLHLSDTDVEDGDEGVDIDQEEDSSNGAYSLSEASDVLDQKFDTCRDGFQIVKTLGLGTLVFHSSVAGGSFAEFSWKSQAIYEHFLRRFRSTPESLSDNTTQRELSSNEERVLRNYVNELRSELQERLSGQLSSAPFIDLGHRSAPESLARYSNPHRAASQYRTISEAVQVAGYRVLIEGSPGSGKTTTLMQLALGLTRDHRKMRNPIAPVFVNLSEFERYLESRYGRGSFTRIFSKKAPGLLRIAGFGSVSTASDDTSNGHSEGPSVEDLESWLKSEMDRYPEVQKYSASWQREKRFALFLDGLDEVREELRPVVVELINQLCNRYLGPPILVTCREAEYSLIAEDRSRRLNLSGCVKIQPLGSDQVSSYLNAAGASELIGLIENDANLKAAVRTPLELSILTLAFSGQAETVPEFSSPEDAREHLLEKYFHRMIQRFERRRFGLPLDNHPDNDVPANKYKYSTRQVGRFLEWLAERTDASVDTRHIIDLLNNAGTYDTGKQDEERKKGELIGNLALLPLVFGITLLFVVISDPKSILSFSQGLVLCLGSSSLGMFAVLAAHSKSGFTKALGSSVLWICLAAALVKYPFAVSIAAILGSRLSTNSTHKKGQKFAEAAVLLISVLLLSMNFAWRGPVLAAGVGFVCFVLLLFDEPNDQRYKFLKQRARFPVARLAATSIAVLAAGMACILLFKSSNQTLSVIVLLTTAILAFAIAVNPRGLPAVAIGTFVSIIGAVLLLPASGLVFAPSEIVPGLILPPFLFLGLRNYRSHVPELVLLVAFAGILQQKYGEFGVAIALSFGAAYWMIAAFLRQKFLSKSSGEEESDPDDEGFTGILSVLLSAKRANALIDGVAVNPLVYSVISAFGITPIAGFRSIVRHSCSCLLLTADYGVDRGSKFSFVHRVVRDHFRLRPFRMSLLSEDARQQQRAKKRFYDNPSARNLLKRVIVGQYSTSVQCNAIAVAGSINDFDFAPLLVGINNQDAEVRCSILLNSEKLSVEERSQLTSRTQHDPSIRVQIARVAIAEKTPSSKLIQTLLHRLTISSNIQPDDGSETSEILLVASCDKHPKMRSSAIAILSAAAESQRGTNSSLHDSLVPILVDTLRHRDVDLRTTAVSALGKLNDSRVVPPLLKAAGFWVNGEVRLSAVRWLATKDDRRVRTALRRKRFFATAKLRTEIDKVLSKKMHSANQNAGGQERGDNFLSSEQSSEISISFERAVAFSEELNFEKAIAEINKLTDRSYGPAFCYLGVLNYTGIGVPENRTDSERLFRIGIELIQRKSKLDLNERYRLAEWYWCGYFQTTPDRDRAESLFKTVIPDLKVAANNGNVSEMIRLARCYRYGIGMDRSDDEALNWEISASLYGSVFARERVARTLIDAYITRNDKQYLVDGMTALLAAANFGLKTAQASLEEAYLFGFNVPQNFVESHKWYDQARINGHNKANSRCNLTRLLSIKGREPLDSVRVLAEEGDPESLFLLGMLGNIPAGKKSVARALATLQLDDSFGQDQKTLLNKAANSGHPAAQSLIRSIPEWEVDPPSPEKHLFRFGGPFSLTPSEKRDAVASWLNSTVGGIPDDSNTTSSMNCLSKCLAVIYPDSQLHYLWWCDAETLHRALIVECNGEFKLLDGSNNSVYLLNREVGLKLTEKNAADYVRFFFAVVAGKLGRFFLAESLRSTDLAAQWYRFLRRISREWVPSHLQSMQIIAPENGFGFSGSVVFQSNLFACLVRLQSNGNVSIFDQKLLAEDVQGFPAIDLELEWVGKKSVPDETECGPKTVEHSSRLFMPGATAFFPEFFTDATKETWHEVTEEERQGFFEQISPVDGRWTLSSKSDTVFWRTLPFYESVSLLNVRSKKLDKRNTRLFYLVHQQNLFRLDGTSPPIHEVNAKAPIELNEDNVLDYLRFFCFFVLGKKHPFYIAEDLNDPLLPQTSKESVRREVENVIRPASLQQVDTKGQFLCKAVVFYRKALFTANFSVQPNGMVEMLKDDIADLYFPGKVKMKLS